MTHRFFIPPDSITPPVVTLPPEVARQVKTVLRMRPGAEIIVLDDSRAEWRVRLTEVSRATVQGEIITQQPAKGEPDLHLTLYQGTLKGQKFEWVLQKGTELGVSRFVPLICRRSIVRRPAALAKKQSRWEQIIREAAEQSGRGRWPRLAPAQPLPEALKDAQTANLILLPWEAAEDTPLKTALTPTPSPSIALFIGPEGGFEPAEAELARQHGARLVTLGPRILRAETAGLAACAAIMYQAGEWRSR